jgi:hypothetical protein
MEGIDSLRFPIGRFKQPPFISSKHILEAISTIADFPNKLKSVTANLTDAQLDTPYRIGGWTIRQVVHHCADSHINSLVRFKLALTENNPVITPYREELWAELPDSLMPIDSSIFILEGLHSRWTLLLQSLSESDLAKGYVHPEQGKLIRLDIAILAYAWHCEHHLAHITNSLDRTKADLLKPN